MKDLAKIIYRWILCRLPAKPAVYLIYYRGYHKVLNLKNPQYFGEKIQWLKLYGHLDELHDYVDKYEVRKYVAACVGEQYLNELYGVYDHVDDIDFDALPNQFVLKCTNGSRGVLICKDRTKFNIETAKKEMEKWLTDEFYKIKKESQYKNVKNRIIVEKYLEDETGALRDYKFYCYDGEPYYYGVFTDRYTDETIDMYDMQGEKLQGIENNHVKNSNIVLSRPENFNELVEITRKLAKKFQFVRVDYYIADRKIIFGELTFTDGAGSNPFSPLSFDLEMGRRIKLGRMLLNEN
jgi:hypothetical protein